MKSIQEVKAIVKSLVLSSPNHEVLLSEIDRVMKSQEGRSLNAMAREFNFANIMGMIATWEDDFTIVGSGLDTVLKSHSSNHIKEMNKKAKSHKVLGFGDIMRAEQRNLEETDPYAFEAELMAELNSSEIENTKTIKPNPPKVKPKIIMSDDKKIEPCKSLDITKPLVIRFLDAINPHRFWFAPIDDYKRLNELMEQMQDFYSKENELNVDRKHLMKGMYVAFVYAKLWHRGIVRALTKESVQIFCIDFGSVETIKADDDIRYLKEEYLEVPRLSQRGVTSHIQPTNGKWSEECNKFFKENLTRKLINVKIFKKNLNDTSYQLAIRACIEGKEDSLMTKALIDHGWCEFDKEFCGKDLVNPNELEFEDYEAGKHLTIEVQPIAEEDDWLPVMEQSFETVIDWLPAVKLNASNISNMKDERKGAKSSDIMKSILDSSSLDLSANRRRRIEIVQKRNIIDQSLSRLSVGSIFKVFLHVVQSTEEFYFYLMDDFEEIFDYLKFFNECYSVSKTLAAKEDLVVGTDVVTFADENYCRGRIMEKLSGDSYQLMLVDFGIVVERPQNEIFKLDDQFKDRQGAVYKGKLANLPEHFHLKTRDQLSAIARKGAIEVKIHSIAGNIASLLLLNP